MSRTSRTLWETLSLEYVQRVSPYRAFRRSLCVLFAAGATLWVVFAIVRNDESMFTSGPMSIGHGMLADDCAKCHTEKFRRLRFFSDREKAHAMNEACLSCHGETIGHDPDTMTAWHYHSERAISENVELAAATHLAAGQSRNLNGAGVRRDVHAADSLTACSSCHVEHKGAIRLVDIDDRQCIDCHADLEGLGYTVQIDPTIESFAGGISSGEDDRRSPVHPEFSLLATGASDPGRIRFNHRRHLHPDLYGGGEGLMGPDPGDKDGVHLQCRDCHVAGISEATWRFAGPGQNDFEKALPTESGAHRVGAFMMPISYENHCAACHPLIAGDLEIQLEGTDSVPAGHVPHASPEAVRTYLRGQLAEFATDAQRVAGAKKEKSHLVPPLLAGQNRTAEQDRQLLEWVEHRIVDIEERLYGRENQGCVKCHESVGNGHGTLQGPPGIVPPNIPDRWYTSASFNHERHKTIVIPGIEGTRDANCVFCHRGVDQSELTSDVHLPGIDRCRECHSPARRAGDLTHGGVSDRCVMCHSYHRPARRAAASLTNRETELARR